MKPSVPISKEQQLKKKRIKKTQRQLGSISRKVRDIVKIRSENVCEICKSKLATQMAHIIGRKQIEHQTTENDLLHVCVVCHLWLDTTYQGILYKNKIIEKKEFTK